MGRFTGRKKSQLRGALRARRRHGWMYLEAARWLALGGAYDRALQTIGRHHWAYRYPIEAMQLYGNVLALQVWDGRAPRDQLAHAADLLRQALCLDPGNLELAEDLADVLSQA